MPTTVIKEESTGAILTFATRHPAPHLRGIVRDLTGYTERTAGFLLRREFPGPQVVVIFEFGPSIRICDPNESRRFDTFRGGFVAGLSDSFTLTEHDGFQRGIQANFTPIGAHLFFGIPMSELTGRVIRLADVLEREHSGLTDRLADLPTWDARFDLLESIISQRVAREYDPRSAIPWAFRQIEESGGGVDIRRLCLELGYSHKHVISLFRDHVGVTPKQLARVVRFDRLMNHLKSGGGGSWADLALAFGYADQSHLSREVRSFTGTTPTKARALLTDLTHAAFVER